MPDVKSIIAPARLPSNPVWRSYAGGSVLRSFRGRDGTNDDHFPEDWLASTVRARNGAHSQGPDEGLSLVETESGLRPLPELLVEAPAFWLGTDAPERVDSNSTGVLWKLLDSSVRLQFQAHPDRAFARRHLNSNAGKTECWYILATRGEAHVYLGFQQAPTRDEWGAMLRDQRVDAMSTCFEKIPVRPGDCYVVPAGTPHAIGEGIFMLELQEPTDWVVRCERTNAGVTLPPEACYMGLDLDRCLDVFDYRQVSVAQVRERFQQQPRVLSDSDAFREEEIISGRHHEFFRLHRLRGGGDARWAGGELMLLIALRGGGTLGAGATALQVRGGETWLLPGAAREWQWTANSEQWEFLLAKLPRGNA